MPESIISQLETCYGWKDPTKAFKIIKDLEDKQMDFVDQRIIQAAIQLQWNHDKGDNTKTAYWRGQLADACRKSRRYTEVE